MVNCKRCGHPDRVHNQDIGCFKYIGPRKEWTSFCTCEGFEPEPDYDDDPYSNNELGEWRYR